jgi:hypothetical protein
VEERRLLMITFEHPIFKYAFADHRFLEGDDPLKEHMDNIVTMFDALVDTLREPKSFPNPRINELVKLMWRLIGNQVVKVALNTQFGHRMPGAAFSLMGNQQAYEAIIWLPTSYAQMVVHDRIFHMGGICFNASQCRDFYNGKVGPGKNPQPAQQRALAYEAEFINTIAQADEFKPNDWQKQVMEQFPKGLASVQNLLYKPKKFMDAK